MECESSNINEVIGVILNIFYEKIPHAQKAQKRTKSEQKTKKTFLNALKKHLMGKKVAYSLICVFILFLFVKQI